MNSNTALATSVKGITDSADKFSKAAESVVKNYAAAANIVSGASSGENLSPETLAAASDTISPVVNMMTSQHAYKANLEVFSVVSDMEDSLLDVLA